MKLTDLTNEEFDGLLLIYKCKQADHCKKIYAEAVDGYWSYRWKEGGTLAKREWIEHSSESRKLRKELQVLLDWQTV